MVASRCQFITARPGYRPALQSTRVLKGSSLISNSQATAGRRLVPNIVTVTFLAVTIDLTAHPTPNVLPSGSIANAVDRQNGSPDGIPSVVQLPLALQSFFLG